MSDDMAKKWDAAAANPGEKIPVGDTVVCDDCDQDYTKRPDVGGIIFESKAICPSCTPKWLAGARKYHEEDCIRARCSHGQSFADFVRAYRGPDAFIRVTSYGRTPR